MNLEASTELLAQQWQNSPKLMAAIDAPLETIRESVLPPFDTLDRMRTIENAEGVWLDFLGRKLGIDRPTISVSATSARFGFEGATRATGFDRAPFHGSREEDPIVPLPDALFRRLVRARGVVVRFDGSIQMFVRACRHIDPSCSVVDNRDMTVTIVTDEQDFFELAESAGALPRTAGVGIIYSQLGLFGFEGIGEGFDQAPFRGSQT